MDVAFKILVLWKLTCCLAIATEVSGENVACVLTSKKNFFIEFKIFT